MSFGMPESIHADIQLVILGEDFFLGHGDLPIDPDTGVINRSKVAELLHEIAWRVEGEELPEIDEAAPIEPHKSEFDQKSAVKTDDSKGRVLKDDHSGVWYEVQPDKFVHADGWESAQAIYSRYNVACTEQTLRTVFKTLTEVEGKP
jgi:hypothetical protein